MRTGLLSVAGSAPPVSVRLSLVAAATVRFGIVGATSSNGWHPSSTPTDYAGLPDCTTRKRGMCGCGPFFSSNLVRIC